MLQLAKANIVRNEIDVLIGLEMNLNFSKMRYKGLAIAIASCVSLLSTLPANAAEQVVLKFLVFQESIEVSELSTFGETGELSPTLQAYMAMSKQEPEKVRNVLTKPVTIDPLILDRVLNSPVGNILLDRIGEAIHTPSSVANRQAMRSALVLSASDDRQITLLEVIQKYPTQAVHVEGDRLLEAYSQLSRIGGQVQDILNILKF